MYSDQGAAAPSRPKRHAPAHSLESNWWRAVRDSSRDAMVILDSSGTVIEMNETFSDLFGYRPEDGPYSAPYPWWPTEEEDADALSELREAHADILAQQPVEGDYVLYCEDRRKLRVHSLGASMDVGDLGVNHLRILRDVTRDWEARERRAAAAKVSWGFATFEDLGDLVGIAEHGFGLLFDGECTIRLGHGTERRWFGPLGTVDPATLPQVVQDGLEGGVDPDTVTQKPGILLLPPVPDADCRAWVQFPQPRRINLEELIAADLLAAAFATAVQRILAAQAAAGQAENLRFAVESHRLIGQATGILVERHHLRPGEAFERLRRASQNRNLKLRDLAARVIETGTDPDEA